MPRHKRQICNRDFVSDEILFSLKCDIEDAYYAPNFGAVAALHGGEDGSVS